MHTSSLSVQIRKKLESWMREKKKKQEKIIRIFP